jgi:hypothetical protein
MGRVPYQPFEPPSAGRNLAAGTIFELRANSEGTTPA